VAIARGGVVNDDLTTTQVAKILGCSVSTVKRFIENERLEGYRYGFHSQWRIPLDGVKKFAKTHGRKINFDEFEQFETDIDYTP
jgi:excisionase family DNA binding protein